MGVWRRGATWFAWSFLCQIADVDSLVCLLVGYLTSQQHASVSLGRICSDMCTCCHNEMEVADQTLYLTQSPYTDTRPTSPSADPVTPGARQGSHWSANFLSHWYYSTRVNIHPESGNGTHVCLSRGRRLNHKANEAVSCRKTTPYCVHFTLPSVLSHMELGLAPAQTMKWSVSVVPGTTCGGKTMRQAEKALTTALSKQRSLQSDTTWIGSLL